MGFHEPRLRPRRVDYVMWTLVGLSMASTAAALLNTRNVYSWAFGIGYITLGAVLIRWRWLALRHDAESRRTAAADEVERT